MLLNTDQHSFQMNLFHLLAKSYVDNKPRVLILEGSAGTGKTTAIRETLEALRPHGEISPVTSRVALYLNKPVEDTPNYAPDTLLTAPTHKALGVYATYSAAAQATIHSAFKARFSYSGEVSWGGNTTHRDLCIVDETSMLSKDMCDIILADTTKLTVFVGDPYQLLSVEESKNKTNFNPFEYIKEQADPVVVKLDKVTRQSEGNPIIQLAQEYRKAIEGDAAFKLPEPSYTVHYLEGQEFSDKFLSDLREGKKVKVLAYTNKAVKHVNDNTRTMLGYGPDTIHAGELVVGRAGHANGREHTIKHTLHKQELSFVTTGLALDLEGRSLLSFNAFSHSPDKKGKLGRIFIRYQDFDVLWKKYRAIERKQGRKQISSIHFLDKLAAQIGRKIFVFDFNYAGTVHTAQGSTYDDVYLLQKTFPTSYHMRQDANRLMYVGCTRTRNNIYMVK